MQSGATHVELKALHRLGWSVSALAREFGLSRNTVYRELESEEARRYGPRVCPGALSAAQLAHVERRLSGCPQIRSTDLHAELCRDLGYQASYVTFQRQVRVLRPAVVRDPEIRFETDCGVQTQVDWAHIGNWPLGSELVPLHTMIAILGYSRAPAIRFATDLTRPTSLRCVVWCLHDLGGVTKEVLSDRDPAFCIGQTSNGAAILAPEWVDQCELLGVVPKACRPYRAKTKGKVERMVRELKESLLPWLGGQPLPAHPTLHDYDRLARRWIQEIVLTRRHRTTGRVTGEAWEEEREHLTVIPDRVLRGLEGDANVIPLPVPEPPTAAVRALGEKVEARDLGEYEALAR